MWLILRLGGLGCIFSVGNREKMGAKGLGNVKYNFWGQNNVVLAIISFFFFLIQITNQNGVVSVSDNLSKTTPFWTLAALNDVVLSCTKKIKKKSNDVIFCPTETK